MNNKINGINKIDRLDAIPGGTYIGYYWMSDQETPEPVNGRFEPKISGNNPFIIEAMLWDDTNEKSIMITHTGRYHIYEYDIAELEKQGVLEDKAYMPHRLDEKTKKVKFKQFWLPERDSLCEGMDVLKLKAIVFVGFDS